uniref:Uncharacterized protein n=1 Tax=Caenorhabditis japonica TaxID=281687 RepID=A0A8R1I9Z8_CAEJA
MGAESSSPVNTTATTPQLSTTGCGAGSSLAVSQTAWTPQLRTTEQHNHGKAKQKRKWARQSIHMVTIRIGDDAATNCVCSFSLGCYKTANNCCHHLKQNIMKNNWTPGNNERKGEEGLGDRRYKEKKNWQLTHPACIQGHTSSSHQRILMVQTNYESLNHATAKTHRPHTTMRPFTKLSPPPQTSQLAAHCNNCDIWDPRQRRPQRGRFMELQ